MDNMTAKVSCFARAYHHKNNSVHVFDDGAAEAILGKDYEEISKSMIEGLPFFFPDFKGTKEEGLRQIVDKQLAPSVLGRSAFCKRKLAEEVKNGCGQYLILASGAGEQMKALYSNMEIVMLLQQCGFKLVEHLDSDEMTKQYFETYNRSTKYMPMKAPKGVGYVLAKKVH